MSEAATRVPHNMVFVKKITASLGHLRRLTAIVDDTTGEVLRPESPPVPVMRIRGIVTEGWQEASAYGEFIRWVGEFGAEVIQRDGSVVKYISRNLILPGVGEDFVALAMIEEQRETSTKDRTGVHFSPGNDFGKVKFMLDLWISPPKDQTKKSATGYEFECRPVIEPGMSLGISEIGAEATPFVPAVAEEKKEALPAPTHEAADADPAPAETKPKHGKK